MKKILLLLGLGVILTSATVLGDANDIIDALKSGNASEVSQYFDNFIDITLPGKEEVTSMGKNQASISLKQYYDEAAVKTFQLTSSREAGAITSITGKLQGKSKNENITIMLKKSNSKYYITSIRIG